MGCDIHLVLEKKVDDRWIGIHAFPAIPLTKKADEPYAKHAWWPVEGRNYERFAALAGVRGDGPEHLGFPNDASELASLYFRDMEADAHSESFLSIRDFLKVICVTDGDEAGKEHMTNLLEGDWLCQAADKYLGHLDEEHLEDYRIVFWFDH